MKREATLELTSTGVEMHTTVRLALLCLLMASPGCAMRGSAPKYPPTRTAVAPDLLQDSDVRQIRGQYEVLSRGFEAQDTTAIAAVRTSDFYVDYPDGRRQGPTEMLEVLRYFFVQNKPPIRIWYTLMSTERSRDEIALVVFQQASRYQELSGQLRKVEHDITQRETWRREEGFWKLRSVDSIHDPHRWVDGKPIDPSKPYDPTAPPYRPSGP